MYSQFTTDVIVGNTDCWAKTGYMVVKVTGSYLFRVDFGFGYNHGISSTAATITLDSNLGLTIPMVMKWQNKVFQLMYNRDS